MRYAIVGFGKIGQALAHAFARKNIDVTVASRRSARGVGTAGSGDWTHGRRQVAAGCTRGRHNHLAVPFGEHREVAQGLPSWKGKTVIDATNSFPVPPEELDGLPSSAFVREVVHRRQAREGFQPPACRHPGYRSGRRGRAIGSSFCRATTRTRSLPWRIWPNNSGSHPSSWASSTRVARWCTHAAALGVSSSSGSVQEGAVVDLRPCDLARNVRFQNVRFDRARSHATEMDRFQ
jgi:hypothetical protein